MKKWIIGLVVVGMVGWAVFEFIQPDENAAELVQDVEGEEAEDEVEGHDGEIDELEVVGEDDVADVVDVAEPDTGLEVGNMAPDFQLETLSGEVASLSDFRGQRVMLNFWATWCPPCRAEMPDMQKIYEEKDVVILAVNLAETESSIEAVEDFTEDFQLTFPVLLDEQLDVATLYQIQPIPTSYMIDSDGVISNMAFGALNYDLMVQEFEKMK